ncbi:unnamed protein product, partial [Polarella glacialis]
ETQTEEGMVKILAKLLFVNGSKKQKLTDLGSPPERGDAGRQVILRFAGADGGWCDMRFDRKKQGDEFEQAVLEATSFKGMSSWAAKKSKAAVEAESQQLWEEKVRAAVGRTPCQRFTNPFPMGFNGLAEAPGQVSKLVVEMCVAWEAADRRRYQGHKETTASLEAERDEDQRIRKQAENDQLQVDAKLCKAEASCASLQKTNDFLNKEIALLKKSLAECARAEQTEHVRFLEKEVAALRQQMKEGFKKKKGGVDVIPPALEGNMARAIAELEAGPLLHCPAKDRPALKKKMLLKWHPDKQPSPGHAELAKRVMQELQNLSDWMS